MNRTKGKQPARIVFVSTFATDVKGAKARAAILRTGTFQYKGRKLSFTTARLNRIVKNFERFNRAEEIPLDYDHGTAIGTSVEARKAAGWLVALSVEPDPDRKGQSILWGDFKVNPPAKEYVENGEYRFLSAEIDENYMHPEAQEDVGDYLQAIALTNRPFVENLPGMVLMTKAAAELAAEVGIEVEETAGEGRAARGSDSPHAGARADGEGEGLMKINLTQFGGPAEGTEEDVQKILASHKASLTDAEAKAKAASDRAEKAEAEAKTLLAKAGETDEAKKALLTRIASLEQDKSEREFDRMFDAAKVDPAGARVVESERKFLKTAYLSHVAAGTVPEFEKYLGEKPRILATRPSGSDGSGSGNNNPSSAEAKFMAAVGEKLSKDSKITFTQAASQVARENPSLSEAYTAEQKAKVGPMHGGSTPSGEVV